MEKTEENEIGPWLALIIHIIDHINKNMTLQTGSNNGLVKN